MNTPNPTPDRPPLWRVMELASEDAQAAYYPFASSDRVLAAEIRALRDWLVPDEPLPHRGMRPGGSNLTYQETLSVERQRLRAMLTAEADRAERGETADG